MKKIPERKCVGCGEKKPKNELIRIVRPQGSADAELDKTGKKAGRGAYICPNPMCLKKAKKRLEANLEAKISDEIFAKLERETEND